MKKKKIGSRFCWSFSFLMALLAFGAFGADQDEQKSTPEKATVTPPTVVRELIEKRTGNARHYLLDNGNIRAEISGAPTHVKDETGTWRPINPRFASVQGLWRAEGSLARFSMDVDSRLWLAAPGTSGASVELSALTYQDGQGEHSLDGAWAPRGPKNLKRGQGVFAEELTLGEDRLVQEWVLTQVPEGLEDPQLESVWTLPEGWTLDVRNPDLELDSGPRLPILRDENGKPRFWMLPPIASEDGVDPSAVVPGELMNQQGWVRGQVKVADLGDQRFRITVTFPADWFQTPNRQYPVRLDPSLTVNGDWGGFIYYLSPDWVFLEANPYTAVYMSGDATLASNPTAGYINFDISSLPTTARVISAQLEPYMSAVTGDSFIAAYPASGYAPLSGSSQSELQTHHSDFRGGDLMGLFYVTTATAPGMLPASGNSVSAQDLQRRIPDGSWLTGWLSDGTGLGDSSYRLLESGPSRVVVEYEPSRFRHLVISEVNRGNPDWVEIYNYGNDMVMTGMELHSYDGTQRVYTFPTFTLKRHQHVTLKESTGTDTATTLYTGVGWGWGSSSAGDVGLTLGSNYGIDYVSFNDPTGSTVIDSQSWMGESVQGTGNYISRNMDPDTDQALDWTVSGSGTEGAMNPGQVGSRRRSHLVINEVSTNPDSIEILNLAPVPQAMDGFIFETYFNGSQQGSYVFPAGTEIAAGGILRLSENSGTDTFNHKYLGYNISWVNSSKGEVRLRKAEGQSNPGDYMAFNYPDPWHWPTGLDWHGTNIDPVNSITYQRVDHLDSDSVFDWQGTSSNNLGLINPGQVNPLLSRADELGSSTSSYTYADFAYGNRFTISENQILVSFKQDITLNEDQVITMMVMENSGGGNNIVRQINLGTVSAGSQIVSSGNLNLPLVGVRTYTFITHGAGNTTYRREYVSGGVTERPHLGTYDGASYAFGAITTSLSNVGPEYSMHQWIETLDVASLEPLTIATTALPDASQSSYYSQQVIAAGGAGGYSFSKISGSYPTGISLSSSGLITGTPSVSGDYSFTLRVTDAFGDIADRALTLHVIGTSGLRFLTEYIPGGVVGQDFPDLQMAADGGTPAYGYTVAFGSLPLGLGLSGTGALTGTPSTAGTYTFSIRLLDSGSGNILRPFTIEISDPFVPPYWVRKGLNGGEMEMLALSDSWVNDQTAFAVVAGDRFFRTVDGGLNWDVLTTGLFQGAVNWLSFDLVKGYDHLGPNGHGKTIYAYVYLPDQSSYYPLRSTNGGDSWSILGSAWGEMSPDFINDGHVVRINAAGGIDLSGNHGASFSTIASTLIFEQVMFSPSFASDQTLFAVGDDNWTLDFPLYRSTDLGQTWQLLSITNGMGEFRFSPNFSSDSTVFGFGEAPCICVGIMKSTDGGVTWTGVTDASLVIQKLMLSPEFDNNDPASRSLVVSMGYYRDDIFLYRSTNGALDWSRITTAIPDEGGDIGYLGGGMWAPMERTFRPLVMSPNWENDQTLVAGQDGFWVSEDGGVSWEKRASGLNGIHFRNPNLVADVQVALAYSPNFASDNTFFLATADGGLYKSTNRGSTLTRLNIPHLIDPATQELDVRGIALSNTYNDLTGTDNDTVNETKTLFISAEGGVYRSRDGGQTWLSFSLPVGPYTVAETYQLELIKTSPNFGSDKTVMAANKWHLWRSTNAGANWVVISKPSENLRDIAFSPYYNLDDTVLISTSSKVWRSANFNLTTPAWAELLNGGLSVGGGKIQLGNGYRNGSGITRRKIFWVGDQKTTDNGSIWSTVDPGVLSTRFYNDDTLLRTPTNPVSVRLSTNGGASDSAWSLDVDLNIFGLELGPFIAPNYYTSTGVVTYLYNGALLISEDGGQSFVMLDGTNSISNDIRGVETDPSNPAIIFAATGDAGLFKSTDQGLTFHQLTKGLPSVNQEFNDIRALSTNTIIAGHAVDGVYRSTDSGINWNQMADSTGNVQEFSSGGSYVFAARSDGRSIRSGNSGLNWIDLDPAITDMADFSYRGDVPTTNSFGVSGNETTFNPVDKRLTPMSIEEGPSPFGIQSPTWGVSKTSGPVASEDDGVTFTSSTGSGGPFPLPTGVDYLSVLALASDTLQVITGTNGLGIWKTWDGGDTWHRMTWGLESSSAIVTELYETSAGDILAGITGTTDGGVYLSADGGEHWAVINEGFDPDELSVQDLVNDPGDGTTISYWAGKDEDGIWTRTIDILPDPEATSMSSTTSAVVGGVTRSVFGSNFQDGAVVFFDGIPGTTTFISAGQLNVVVPAHYVGTAQVVVMNPDTRVDATPLTFTYTEIVVSKRVDLSVTTDGTDVTLTWTDPLTRGSYNVFWTTDLDFGSEWTELAAESVAGPSWTHGDAALTSFVYFYKVE